MNLEAIAPLVAASMLGLVSGFNDGGNLMASFTSRRVITPRVAALLLVVASPDPLHLAPRWRKQLART